MTSYDQHFQRENEAYWEMRYGELPDAEYELECPECATPGHTAHDKMFDLVQMCAQCWVQGNLELMQLDPSDDICRQEMMDAIQRSLDWAKPIAQCYAESGYPTKDKKGDWQR